MRTKIAKVFHAGSQDMEIFLHLMGDLPQPIYDTEITAMVRTAIKLDMTS